MKETHEYLIPRYFRDFSCKMGACRKSCCEGWPVTVSMKNYFTLLGLPCRKELRDRLDCALRVLDRPTEEEYARFSPNWLGDCPMRMEDGRCSIHAELGEDALSDVCRLYPRGVRRFGESLECSLSNSCEGVVELLFRETEPMTFSRASLPLTPPPFPGSPAPTEGFPTTEEARFSLIAVLQDRTRSLPDRLLALRESLRLPSLSGTGGPGDAVSAACRLLGYFAQRSDSIREEAALCLARYEETPAAYREDRARFENRFPDWEIRFEQLIVNHVFFSQFPYQGGSLRDAWTGLAAAWALLRLLAAGKTTSPGPPEEIREEDLADTAAAAFRLIDHTRFGETAARLLDDAEALDLIRL